MIRGTKAIPFAVVLLAGACALVTEDHSALYEQCGDTAGTSPEQRIEACTAAIAVGGRYEWQLPYFHADRARAWSDLGQHEKAIADASKAIELEPGDATFLVGRAVVHMEAADVRAAMADLNAAITAAPDEAFGYRARGTLLIYAGAYEKGSEDIKKVVNLGSPNAADYTLLGRAYVRLGQDLFAIPVLNEAIKLDATSSRAFSLRSEARRRMFDLNGAMSDADEAIRLDPENDEAFSARSWVWSESEDYPKSIADIDEAARLAPRSFIYEANRCSLRLIAGIDLEGATAGCDVALELEPRDPDMLSARGVILLRLERFDAAAADFGACVDDQLAKLEADRDELDYAFCLYGRSLTTLKTPGSDTASRETALKSLTEAAELRPDVPETYAGYGLTP
jgi:tetratricopeptide (TPR) repeat protein